MHWSSLAVGALLACLAFDTAHAAAPAPQTDDVAERAEPDKWNLGKHRLAIEGYDPVTYFPEGGGDPKKGDAKITERHRGVVYRFRDEAHRELFRATPERYEPAYGGWCAWAMSSDDRVEVDPESFLIQDGELLLFYDGFFADTRKKWRKGDVDALKRSADANWKAYYPHAYRDLSRWNAADGLALGGHDPVAYFGTAPKVVAGKAPIAHTYRDITYRFADDASRKRFLQDPNRYEPRAGGWDPVALSAGERAAGTPRVFRVHDDHLWIFASEANAARFDEDPAAVAAAAEKAFRGR